MAYLSTDLILYLILAIPVVMLARHLPMDGDRWPIGLALHALGAGMFSMLKVTTSAVVHHETVESQFNTGFHWNIVVYAAIAALSHAVAYRRSLHELDRRALELQARLAEAELHALKMQLQPHFLFNTLETISALMYRDVEAADRTVARLGDLLRQTLRLSSKPFVTLREELQLLDKYLEIERTRFEDRLLVRMDIDPDAMDAAVPNLILQPLVENAIRHGVAPKASQGEIRIRASQNAGRVLLEVSDNGGGIPGRIEEGIGISNTRRRVEQMKGTFIMRTANGGLIAALELPWMAVGS